MVWLDVAKGAAMIGILGVHAVERSRGGAYWANPAADWPDLDARVRQWRPTGDGFWAMAENPVRWLGWLGDLAPSLFVLVTGFLLLRAAPVAGGYLMQVWRRLARFLPMFWLAFAGATALALVTGMAAPVPSHGAFWLSLIGFRASPGTIYYGAMAWWYVGFLVQLAFVAPWLVSFLAPSPRALRRAWRLVVGAITLKLVLLLALAGTVHVDPVNRGGVFFGKLPALAAGLLLAVQLREAPDPQHALRRALRLPLSMAALGVGFLAAFTLAGNAFAGLLVALGGVGVAAQVVGTGSSVVARALTFVSQHSLAIFLAHPIANQLATPGPFGLQVALRITAAIVLGIASGVALERAYDVVRRVVGALLPPRLARAG